VLGTSQSNVSQLERGDEPLLSSVAKYVHALGGELKVTAVIGDTTYTLLDDASEAPQGAQSDARPRTRKPSKT
jgi:hypothetical protein